MSFFYQQEKINDMNHLRVANPYTNHNTINPYNIYL